jgi:hypothetical protein
MPTILARGFETLVVIPFWEEIERFNADVRDALRRHGLLGRAEVTREAVKPLSWTEKQKIHWENTGSATRFCLCARCSISAVTRRDG